jgi:hypothetical protein
MASFIHRLRSIRRWRSRCRRPGPCPSSSRLPAQARFSRNRGGIGATSFAHLLALNYSGACRVRKKDRSSAREPTETRFPLDTRPISLFHPYHAFDGHQVLCVARFLKQCGCEGARILAETVIYAFRLALILFSSGAFIGTSQMRGGLIARAAASCSQPYRGRSQLWLLHVRSGLLLPRR